MQRDVGNEVIVAIMAVGVLAFALIFAIILSLSGGSGTATSIPTVTVTVTAWYALLTEQSPVTAVAAVAATATPETDSVQPTAATTQAPGVTVARPSVTATLEASATATAVPPTVTNTRQPLSATPRPSQTPPTLTPTPRPSQTLAITDSATARPALTETAAPCLAPVGWRTYSAQAGDTLPEIAAATSIDLPALLAANCLEAEEALTAGREIHVPRLPGSTTNAGQSPQGNLPRPVGCTLPVAQITSPATGQRVSGAFRVVGTANITQFAGYRIEVRPDFALDYDVYEAFEEPVVNGELARVDSDAYGKGLHWVRLSVVSRVDDSAAVTCAIPMFFD